MDLLFLREQEATIRSRLNYYEGLSPRISRESLEYIAEKRKRIPRLLAALAAIENGTYGTCQNCSDQIPKGRLRVIPAAIYCIGCQARSERKY